MGDPATDEAYRIREHANQLAARQLRSDMRNFVLSCPNAQLSDWALSSEWAVGTGGKCGAHQVMRSNSYQHTVRRVGGHR
jgi:hypothetical protein